MTPPKRASPPSSGARAFAVCVGLLFAFLSAPAQAAYVTERTVLQAEVAYDASNYAQVVELLGHPDDIDALPTKPARIKAFKLLAFSYFFLKHPAEAHETFFGLLKQDPDFQLDRVLDPPAAIEFFEDVRQKENANLAPIRAAIQKDREEEERRKRREREAIEAAEEIRRLARLQLTPPPQIVERRFAQNSALVAWMPFGLGQFQNGHNKLGAALAVTQTITAITSIASFVSIEALREADGRFTKQNYTYAQRFDITKWVAAGLFYGLWVAGAIDANARFVPERLIADAPSAAPVGPLSPPDSKLIPVDSNRSTVNPTTVEGANGAPVLAPTEPPTSTRKPVTAPSPASGSGTQKSTDPSVPAKTVPSDSKP